MGKAAGAGELMVRWGWGGASLHPGAPMLLAGIRQHLIGCTVQLQPAQSH